MINRKDLQLRQKADAYFQQGKRLATDPINPECINLFTQAIHALDQLEKKTDEDHRFATKTYRFLGDTYFNQKQYVHALGVYQDIENIHARIQNKHDDDYRYAVQTYINYSDASLYLKNIKLAATAFQNAMQTFTLIHEKSPAEKKLGNIYHNARAFRDHYENINSTPFYLNSKEYLVHSNILDEHHQQSQVDSIIDNMNQLHILKNSNNTNLPANDIASMFNELNLQHSNDTKKKVVVIRNRFFPPKPPYQLSLSVGSKRKLEEVEDIKDIMDSNKSMRKM